MKYLSGKASLNLQCSLNTCGDWHKKCIDWDNLEKYTLESELSPLGNWGIEDNKEIDSMPVANHLRAILDMIIRYNSGDREFLVNFYKDYIVVDEYNKEFFNKVAFIKDYLSVDQWEQVNNLMLVNFKLKWSKYCKYKLINGVVINNVHIDDREFHKYLIMDILKNINEKTSSFVLKGGTCLLFFYNSDRFSEDVDLDGYSKFDILNFLSNYSKEHNYTYYIKKDTETVKRITIHYNDRSYLKIEISYRDYLNKNLNKLRNKTNEVMVYTLNELFKTKINAYRSRGKLRDIYDLNHMYLRYKTELDDNNIEELKSLLYSEDRDVEYILSILENSSDEYISVNQTIAKIINMYEELDVYIDSEVEKEVTRLEKEYPLNDKVNLNALTFGK